ncbi:MAG: endonuclease III domain-containing protein [Promethearchaeota archaeon]|jgi:endonuclease-3
MNYEEILNKIESIIEGDAHLDELAKKKQDPFKILISTILSARTRDSNTRIATERLFTKYNTPNLIAEAEIENLEELIKVSGFYKIKAGRIKEVSSRILEDYNGEVPSDFEELINLPGVGAKTANCVLVYAFKIPAIPVDTHVHRISNRLGWVQAKNPNKTEQALRNKIPNELWIKINPLFVRFGQQICLPNNPKCRICPIDAICPKDFTMENEMKRKKKLLKS